jgi:hypothetical protein
MTPALLTRMSMRPQRSATASTADVDLRRRRPAAGRSDGGDDFGCRLGVAAVEEGHLGALGGEQLDDRAADAAGAAGDDRDLARKTRFERHGGISPRWRSRRRRPACGR